MAGLTLRGIRKSFGSTEVLRGIDLDIADGEFCVLVGPSGCGKSTLLRLIAGLEDVSAGSIAIGGRDVTQAAPAARGVAMVFQSYALYPHMTVYRNLAFGLKLAKTDADTIDQRVREAARILQIEELLERKPRALSGGQRQRVAIGRAIVRQPQAFLFDEPLSNLDATLRVQMRLEIGRLHRRLGTTMLHVTHDQVEAMTLADKIVVLNAGRIEQAGTPRDLYDRPRNLFVAGFIGSPAMNLLPGRATAGGVRLDGADSGALLPLDLPGDVSGDTPLTVGVRPEHWQIGDAAGAGGLPFETDIVEDLGDVRVLYGTLAGGPTITVREPADAPRRARGNSLAVAPASGAAHLFGSDGMRIGSD